MRVAINNGEYRCSDLRVTEYVVANSPTFGEHGAYVQCLYPGGGVGVRMELEDSHPAVQDCKADNPEMSTDSMEFIDIVPEDAIRRPNGDPVRFWTAAVSERECLSS